MPGRLNQQLQLLLLVSGMLQGNTALAESTPSQADPELRQMLEVAISKSESFSDRYEAEVWLVDMSQRLAEQMPDHEKRLRLLRLIHREATHAELHPELVLAVIDIESNFDRFAISKAGAMGLMQIMPFWLKEIGHPNESLFDIRTNLRMGCTILKFYLQKEKGDLGRALARYNGSLGSYRYTNKILKVLNQKWYKR